MKNQLIRGKADGDKNSVDCDGDPDVTATQPTADTGEALVISGGRFENCQLNLAQRVVCRIANCPASGFLDVSVDWLRSGFSR